jgi:hypothetical protein
MSIQALPSSSTRGSAIDLFVSHDQALKELFSLYYNTLREMIRSGVGSKWRLIDEIESAIKTLTKNDPNVKRICDIMLQHLYEKIRSKL